jgi:hypothetical protein
MRNWGSGMSKKSHMMFRVIRAGIGFLLTAFLFLQGMLCAEKFHSIGYAIMEQALVFLVSVAICAILKSVPTDSWVAIAILNFLILFRRCRNEELENLRGAFQGDRSELLETAICYYFTLLFIYLVVFIRSLKKKGLLALASALLVLLLLNIMGLMVRL